MEKLGLVSLVIVLRERLWAMQLEAVWEGELEAVLVSETLMETEWGDAVGDELGNVVSVCVGKSYGLTDGN